MTRLEQALRWFKNKVKKDNIVYVDEIPKRHLNVLTKNNKIGFNYGWTEKSDYYTLK
jgi:transposase-like protein